MNRFCIRKSEASVLVYDILCFNSHHFDYITNIPINDGVNSIVCSPKWLLRPAAPIKDQLAVSFLQKIDEWSPVKEDSHPFLLSMSRNPVRFSSTFRISISACHWRREKPIIFTEYAIQ
jgi:hypothetical protein